MSILLVVLAGRPGVGKTTIARGLARDLRAALVRIDVIEAALVRCGLDRHPVGPAGYAVAHEICASCLEAGTSVVVDAVNPVAEARAGWRGLVRAGVRLHFVEVALSDEVEHRRRIALRLSDVDGLIVPTWAEALATQYEPWDERRDGMRLCVDGAEADAATATILAGVAGT